jgi:hypothetical protein
VIGTAGIAMKERMRAPTSCSRSPETIAAATAHHCAEEHDQDRPLPERPLVRRCIPQKRAGIELHVLRNEVHRRCGAERHSSAGVFEGDADDVAHAAPVGDGDDLAARRFERLDMPLVGRADGGARTIDQHAEEALLRLHERGVGGCAAHLAARAEAFHRIRRRRPWLACDLRLGRWARCRGIRLRG